MPLPGRERFRPQACRRIEPWPEAPCTTDARYPRLSRLSWLMALYENHDRLVRLFEPRD
jgi:hypothetical protein